MLLLRRACNSYPCLLNRCGRLTLDVCTVNLPLSLLIAVILILGFPIPENEHLFPQTVALLSQIPNVYTAFFSIFEPHTYVAPHWGHWKGYARYQLALMVPDNNAHHQCWIRQRPGSYKTYEISDRINHQDFSMMEESDAEIYYWREGEGVMFDDVNLHDASNDTDQVRVVLFLDIARKLPWYLDILNRMVLGFLIRTPYIAAMRKLAPLVPAITETTGGVVDNS